MFITNLLNTFSYFEFSLSLQKFENTTQMRGLETSKTLNCNIHCRYQNIDHVHFTRYCILIECSPPIRFLIASPIYNNTCYLPLAKCRPYLSEIQHGLIKTQRLSCLCKFFLTTIKLRSLRKKCFFYWYSLLTRK